MEIKTLQFKNNGSGQSAKNAALQVYFADGWKLVSETITPGHYNTDNACCMFLLCGPIGAFMGGRTDGTINVTLQRDTANLPRSKVGTAQAAKVSPFKTEMKARVAIIKQWFVNLFWGCVAFVVLMLIIWGMSAIIPSGSTPTPNAEAATHKSRPVSHELHSERKGYWYGYKIENCGTAHECLLDAAHLVRTRRETLAKPYYATACKKGAPGACVILGMFSSHPNSRRSLEWYRRACDFKPMIDNCAEEINTALFLGNVQVAKMAFEKACTANESGKCLSDVALGTARVRANAIKMFKLACKDGNPMACSVLPLNGSLNQILKKILSLACNDGDSKSCN